MTDEFVQTFTFRTDHDIVAIEAHANGGCTASTQFSAIGVFGTLSEAVRASVAHLRSRARYSDDLLQNASDLSYWERGLIDTFDPERNQ